MYKLKKYTIVLLGFCMIYSCKKENNKNVIDVEKLISIITNDDAKAWISTDFETDTPTDPIGMVFYKDGIQISELHLTEEQYQELINMGMQPSDIAMDITYITLNCREFYNQVLDNDPMTATFTLSEKSQSVSFTTSGGGSIWAGMNEIFEMDDDKIQLGYNDYSILAGADENGTFILTPTSMPSGGGGGTGNCTSTYQGPNNDIQIDSHCMQAYDLVCNQGYSKTSPEVQQVCNTYNGMVDCCAPSTPSPYPSCPYCD